MGDGRNRWSLGAFEVGSLGICYRQQRHLQNVIRKAENFCGFGFVDQMQCGECGTQTTGSQR